MSASIARDALVVLLIVGATAASAAAQSANRSGAGVAPVNKPARAAVTEESPLAQRCRHHCQTLAASGPHQPHASLAETQARATWCLGRMSRAK